MPTQNHWGLARFGKRDGFELTEQLGALTAFDQPDTLARLSHALQLRQEEIRPFAGAEILGLTTLTHGGDLYRLLTLYRYGLDRYKRDGYTALTLALKNCQADSWGWLRALRLLAQPNRTPALCGFDESGQPPFRCQPDQLRRSAATATAIFIPLRSDSLEEEARLLDAWQQQLVEEYQQVYASASPQVQASIDSRCIQIWSENPFQVQSPVAQGATVTMHSAGRGEVVQTVEAPTPDSLVHAFTAEEAERWQRKPQVSVSSPAPSRNRFSNQLLWAGAGLMMVALGLALWWLVG